jgi:hypothetical protein
MMTAPELREMYAWIGSRRGESGVYLAPDNLALSVIVPAGGQVVVMHRFFSNPYVDWTTRRRDRDHMLDRLNGGAWNEFVPLAQRYDVRYVVSQGRLASAADLSCCLVEEWNAGDWHIYRLTRRAMIDVGKKGGESD